ncbi:response regulator transcription factor [Paenibacillus sp. CAU 1782]
MSAIQLLIVEDQELILKSLGIVLGMTPGIDVVGLAENGQTAIEKAEALQPDIILMDIHMPVMNGVDATIIIKKRWPQIKIIILTTFQDIEYVKSALNNGAEGYILKAIDPMDLTNAIQLVHRGEMMITQEVARSLFVHQSSGKAEAEPVPKANCIHDLTERELKVLQLISEGLVNRSIAERLFLSEGTVKNYISSIYSKLGAENRASAMRKAIEQGILQ